MARQPKQRVTPILTCPRCSELTLKRVRRAGKWIWRCDRVVCLYKVEGTKHEPSSKS
jgi:ribosomal protein L37AE/L43A